MLACSSKKSRDTAQRRTTRSFLRFVTWSWAAIAVALLSHLQHQQGQIEMASGPDPLEMAGIIAALGASINLVVLCVRSHVARLRRPMSSTYTMRGRKVNI